MRVAFRTSAGSEIGFGHLRRCMTLADVLRSHGAECVFMIDGESESVRIAEAAGFEAHLVPMDQIAPDAAIIVVDTYRVDADYLEGAAKTGACLVVLDDQADRVLDAADLVVNAAIGADSLPYPANGHTRYLLGPTYALLRSEYASPPSNSVNRRVCRVLITAGGGDPLRLTARLARWASEALTGPCLDIVLGPFADAQLDQSLPRKGVRLHRDPSNMRELMVNADLALCGGGQTLYELAACATPAIAIQVAENQAHNIDQLAAAGTLVAAGMDGLPNLELRVKTLLVRLDTDPELRESMGRRGRQIVDGRGAERVAEEVVA